MNKHKKPNLYSRRHILKSMATGCALPFLPACGFFHEHTKERWLSASGNDKNNYALAWSSPNSTTQKAPSGFRGHGLTQHTNKPNQAIMISRRPGNEGLVMDVNKQTEITKFKSPKHLFMEGHACFNHNASKLFCTESNKHTQQGVITVRETQRYSITEELNSGGIGPHEALLHPVLPHTLIIANGGLIKDKQGKVINGATMASNISLLDTKTGKIKNTFYATENKASLRHIDVSQDGIIAVAMQVQREFIPHENPVPLTALIKGNQLINLTAPLPLLKKMKDYVGSVRINNKYRTAAFTSPKGDLALFWNIDSGEFLGKHFFHNVCGLTVSLDEEYFVLSNSAGKLRHIHCQTLIEQRDLRQNHPQYQWDNHMLTLANA